MSRPELTAREARQQLRETFERDVPFEQKAREALEVGEQYLGADNGHLARVDPGTGYWEAIVSTDPPDGTFPPGLRLELGETYCHRTIETDGPFSLHDTATRGREHDLAAEARGLGSYFGTTIRLDDNDPYGTVCFVGEEPREEQFGESELLFAELVTRLLEGELEAERHEADLTRHVNLVNVLNRVLRHNLRNDLAIVRGHTQVMAEKLGDDTSGPTAIRRIDKLIDLGEKARKLENIVGQDHETTQTDIGALVRDVAEDIGEAYPTASVRVETDEEVVTAVLPSFERAIREVVENAAKHGGDPPTVEISVENVPNAVKISVTDDGPGINELEREVLRTGVETPLVHGTGLGLWLVHWVVTGHDGSVDATVTDTGTDMTITIPRSSTSGDAVGLADLRQARDQYQAVFEEAFDAAYILDDDARIIEANPKAADLFGVDRVALRGRSIHEFLPESVDFDRLRANTQSTDGYRDTTTIVSADGQEQAVEYAATIDIVPGQHLVIARDVTERLERDAKLREAETVFQQTQDAIFLIDVTADNEFHVQRVNEVYEALTGLSNEDIRGKRPQEVVDEEIGNTIEQRYRECVRRRETIEYPEEIPVKGELRYWQTKLTPIVEDDTVVKLVGAMRDVTEQREQRQNLRAERERFQRLLDTSPVGIATLDPSGAFIRANERAEEILGLRESEVAGRQYDDPEWKLVDQDGTDIPSEELPFRRVVETGEPIEGVVHGIESGDGSLRWLSVNAAPLTDSDGNIIRVIAALTDITEDRSGGAEIDRAPNS